MRIGIDARPLCGAKSGVGFYTSNLIKNLSELDKENSYSLYSTAEFKGSFLEKKNFTKKRNRFPPSNVWLQTILPLLLKKDKIDIFHATNFVIPLLASCKSIITIHDLTPFILPEMHKTTNNMVQKLVPLSARKCSKIIAVSRNTKKDIIEHLNIDEEKVAVVHESISDCFKYYEDKSRFKNIFQKYHLPSKFILFVGTIEPRKNIKTLIRAFNRLKKNGLKNTGLVIVGQPGWLFKDIYKEVETLNISNNVKFLNYVSEEDLIALYNIAELFVFPSLYEGFGLPPLEAMACGAPVITSNTSCFPEIIDGAGIMIDPKNEVELSDAMGNILCDNKLKIELREKGFKRVSMFSWKKAASETLKLYISIAQIKKNLT